MGKSSLLNALAGRRIAHVSRTPGKTRTLNVYHMGDYYFLDLPGYGYARAARVDRQAFRGLIAQTLGRERLAGIIWLLDVRHDPSHQDLETQDQLAARGTRILAAITKSDKLPRGLTLRRERELRAALQLDEEQAIVTSARTGEGIGELREAVAALISKATE